MRQLLGKSLPRETLREVQLPVKIKIQTFGVDLQSAESLAYASYLCSQALCAGLIR